MTEELAKYIYKRITEDFSRAHMSHITKDVIDASDIKTYIEEFEALATTAIEKTKYKAGLGNVEEDWRVGTLWERKPLDEEDDS